MLAYVCMLAQCDSRAPCIYSTMTDFAIGNRAYISDGARVGFSIRAKLTRRQNPRRVCVKNARCEKCFFDTREICALHQRYRTARRRYNIFRNNVPLMPLQSGRSFLDVRAIDIRTSSPGLGETSCPSSLIPSLSILQ